MRRMKQTVVNGLNFLGIAFMMVGVLPNEHGWQFWVLLSVAIGLMILAGFEMSAK